MTAAPPTSVTEGTIHSVLVGEVLDTPITFTPRAETVNEVLGNVRGEPLVWLHGSHGVGKSTLARLLAQTIGGRWIALDLRPVQEDAGACLAAWRELIRVLAAYVPASIRSEAPTT